MLDGQGIDVPLAELHVAQSGFLDPGAGEGQHLRRLVDTDGAFGARRDEFEHPAGARAKIEDGVQRRPADELRNGSFDPLLADMQRAKLVPIRRMGGEIAGCLLGAGAPNFREPAAIRLARRILRGERREDIA